MIIHGICLHVFLDLAGSGWIRIFLLKNGPVDISGSDQRFHV